MSNLEKLENRQYLSAELDSKSELLSPVGNSEMLQAAIHNGADAVYIGMPGHNARARSEDFSFDVLKGLINEAHLYGVKVFIAFNILIFEDEILQLKEDLTQCLNLNADALIIQDIGLAYLINKIAPSQVVHASTQMTHTNSRGIELLADLNMKRFVLGREVSLDEMAHIRKNTTKELEVFVHGALCVAYSGQCLTSESFGGRSANRGQCAQSCRISYDLMVDGSKKAMKDQSYLVSPNDLCGLDEIPKLMEIGIDSFKIEGRYKSPEYVALTTQAYHEKMNDWKAKSKKTELEISFSRGFYSGWMHGVNHKKLVPGVNSSHQGAEIGEVLKVLELNPPTILVKSSYSLHKGDGIKICSESSLPKAASKIFQVDKQQNGHYKIEFSYDVDVNKVVKGDLLFMNGSDYLDKQTKLSWSDKSNKKKIGLNIVVSGVLGEPLTVTVSDGNIEGKFFSQSPLLAASNKPIALEGLYQEFNKLGGSIYKVNNFDYQLDEGLFLPLKEFKGIRQSFTKWLDSERQLNLNSIALDNYDDYLKISSIDKLEFNEPKLHVLVREPEQLESLNPDLIDKITLDFKHGVTYGPSLKKIREMGCKAGVATTRILKENQERRLNDLFKHKPDHILVRNLGALHYLKSHDEFSETELMGDFSLNVCNHLSSAYLIEKGLDTICPSYDLNKEQLYALLDHCEPTRYEVTVHQYMPTFHMEHCVFATFLSDGTNAKNCGLVCRDHTVALRDPNGKEHLLQADQECRNTMFNGEAQSAASLIPDLLDKNVYSFRIEALQENSKELANKIDLYHQVIHRHLTPSDLKEHLKINEKFGITEGQLLNTTTYRDRKK